MRRAKIIKIHVNAGEAGLLYATSQDIPGLLVAGETEVDLFASVPLVIKEMMAVKGETVDVVPLDGEDHSIPEPWVLISEARPAA